MEFSHSQTNIPGPRDAILPNPTPSPFSFAVYWGSQPESGDSPSPISFETEKELDAYMDGVEAADGWMEVEFVDGPDYIVNRNGGTVEKKGSHTKATPTERYAL